MYMYTCTVYACIVITMEMKTRLLMNPTTDHAIPLYLHVLYMYTMYM